MSQPSEQEFTSYDAKMRFDDDRPTPPLPESPLGDPTDIQYATLQTTHGGIPMVTVGGKLPAPVAYVVYSVPLSQLVPAPHLLRATYEDDDSFVELKASIREHGGIIEPLVGRPTGRVVEVKEKPEIEIEIWAGIRRMHALQALARDAGVEDSAPVFIPQGNFTEGQMLLRAFAQQEVRRALSLLDKCEVARKLFEEFSYAAEEIGLYLGYTKASAKNRVSELVKLSHEPEQIRKLMANSPNFTMTHALRLVAVEPDPDQRVRLARYTVQEKLSRDHMTRLAAQIKPLPQTGKAPVELVEGPGGKLAKKSTEPSAPPASSATPAPAKKPAPLAYWKRGNPLLALSRDIDQQIQQREQDGSMPVIVGTASAPEVEVESLGLWDWIVNLEAGQTVPIRQLEIVLLADLEMIRAELEDEQGVNLGAQRVVQMPRPAPTTDSRDAVAG